MVLSTSVVNILSEVNTMTYPSRNSSSARSSGNTYSETAFSSYGTGLSNSSVSKTFPSRSYSTTSPRSGLTVTVPIFLSLRYSSGPFSGVRTKAGASIPAEKLNISASIRRSFIRYANSAVSARIMMSTALAWSMIHLISASIYLCSVLMLLRIFQKHS